MKSPGRHAATAPGRLAARVPGRHAAIAHRNELFANTIASWTWSQATLVVSILALPLLTRWLSADEFGLWTQLLSLSALATVADMGMSLVFLRRITDGSGAGRPASTLRSATAFYRASGVILTATLLVVSLIPGGLLSPFQAHTRMPVLAALLVIAATGMNLVCQPSTLRLLAQGRMDLERIFGAGPALVGTLLSILAAYWFATAVFVAIGYAAVEIIFDIGLVVVAYRRWPRSHSETVVHHKLAWWGRLWYESTGSLAVDVVPLISLTIGIAVVGHVVGPEAAALYGLAGKVGSLVRRFFTPFTDSLYVSMCRMARPTQAPVVRLATQLSLMTLAGGSAAALIVLAAGAGGMQVLFGVGYGQGVWIVVVFVLTETIRSIYRPFYRKIQSANGIGSLRYWFAASLAAQLPVAILAALRWSTIGAAFAVLTCSIVFEALPVARRLYTYNRLDGTAGNPVPKQAAAIACAGCLIALLAWLRHRPGTTAVDSSIFLSLISTIFTIDRIRRYLMATRLPENSPLAPNPGSRTSGSEEA